MSTDAHQELVSFHQFLGEQISSGKIPLSPEEALDAWRLEHPSPEQYWEDVQAVREAIAAMEAGEKGTPLETFLTEFRKRHNIDCET